MRTSALIILGLSTLLASTSAMALGNGTPGNPNGVTASQIAAIAPAAGGAPVITGLGANDYKGGAALMARMSPASGNTTPRVTGLGANDYNPSR